MPHFKSGWRQASAGTLRGGSGTAGSTGSPRGAGESRRSTRPGGGSS